MGCACRNPGDTDCALPGGCGRVRAPPPEGADVRCALGANAGAAAACAPAAASPHAAMHAAFCSRDVCSPYGVRSVSSMRVFVSLLRRLLHPQLWFFSLGRQGVLSNPSGFVVVQGVVASSAVLFASTAVGARSAEPNLSIFAHGADIPDRAHSPADSTLPLRRYAGQRGRIRRRGGARAHHNPPPWPSARENPVRRRASGPYGPRLTVILDPWAGER